MEPLTKILTASAELFSQYGFKTITMDDIARRAGISKKTLYLHFANKEEVVKESVIWYRDAKMCDCEDLLKDAENAVEAMVKMMMFFDKMHKGINPMAFFEMQRFYPEAFKIFRNMLEEKDVALMRSNIAQGIKEGLYREGLDPDFMARYRLEASLLIFQPNLMVNDRNSLINVAIEISEHFMYGIMTPKGIQLYMEYKQKYLKHTPTI